MDFVYKKLQVKLIKELYRKNVITEKQLKYVSEILEREINN